MKGFRTVFLKELKRFFTDTRMLIALFVPGILIFALYSFMGSFLTNSIARASSVTDSTFVIAYSDNCGSSTPGVVSYFEAYIATAEPSNKVETHSYPIANLAEANQKVISGEYDVVIAFSDDFETKVTTERGNHIDFYYDGASKKSTAAYNVLVAAVSATYDNYAVNITGDGRVIEPNLTGNDFLGRQIISIVFPMITISILFSTVVSIAPDAVAGEKERGTMSTLLLTPVKRREIALGKAFALIVTAVASGLVSFIGIGASLPRLMSNATTFSLPVWGYALIGLLIVTTLALFVSIGLLVSTFSKSTKEASSYLGPMTIIFLAVSVVPALINTTGIGFAFIPLLNIVSCMSMILVGQVPVGFFLITIGVSVVVTVGLIALIAKLFNSERVMVK